MPFSSHFLKGRKENQKKFLIPPKVFLKKIPEDPLFLFIPAKVPAYSIKPFEIIL